MYSCFCCCFSFGLVWFFNIIILFFWGIFDCCCGFVVVFLGGGVWSFVEDYEDYSPQLPFLSPPLEGEAAMGHVGLCHRVASTVPVKHLSKDSFVSPASYCWSHPFFGFVSD